MAIPVKLEVFEGPLDLLLHLIDKNKVDIYDIPIVDITEQYELTERVREEKVRADEANQAKSAFVSNVSHEIKMPIAIIQSNAELLSAKYLTLEQQQECTETILQSTKRLSNLITNMLKLNKLEKQAIQPMPQVYNLCDQLCECALQFENIWEQKNIEFVADIEERTWIEADRELLELVWNNLLSNALKFTAANGTVTLRQVSSGKTTCITISDTGCGMEQKTLERIFDKFYQGDTSHSTEGNGLGLALVKRILELSDGTIHVESTPGQGSAFMVELQSSPTQSK